MKNILLYASIWLISLAAFGQQVSVNVSAIPPYSPYLLDYILTPGKVKLQLKNNTNQTLQIKLNINISAVENGLFVRTRPNFQPTKPIVLNPNEIKLFNHWKELDDFFDEGNIDYSEIEPEKIARGGFPEGTYNVCIKALDFATSKLLSFDDPLGCSNPIYIRYVEPPVLISPMADSIANHSAINFVWSAAIGIPTRVNYTLRLVELPNSEVNPNAYIESVLVPHFERKNINTTTLFYTKDLPNLRPGKSYAVQITAEDSQKKVIFLNGGKSMVSVFSVGL